MYMCVCVCLCVCLCVCVCVFVQVGQISLATATLLPAPFLSPTGDGGGGPEAARVSGVLVVAVDSVVWYLEIVEGREEVGVRCGGSRQFEQQISAVDLRMTRDGVPRVLVALWVTNEVLLLQGAQLVPLCKTSPGAFDYPVRSLLLWAPC